MALETANVHLGTERARKRILADLKHRSRNWLSSGVRAMAEATITDWKKWKKENK
jgi:hypothetical protein